MTRKVVLSTPGLGMTDKGRQKNKDVDNYGCSEADNIQDFSRGNDMACCTLRVRVNA